jgi:hypothetical protein
VPVRALALLDRLDHEQAQWDARALDPEDLGCDERLRDAGVTHQDVGDGAVHTPVTIATTQTSRS